MTKHTGGLRNKYLPLLTTFLLAGQILLGQSRPYRSIPDNVDYIRIAADSTLHVPFGTTPSLHGGLNRGGGIYYRTTDTSLYIYDGSAWQKVASPGAAHLYSLLDVDTAGLFHHAIIQYDTGTKKWVIGTNGSGSSTDTSHLSARIDARVKITDTSSMLAHYFNQVGYALLVTGQSISLDTTVLAAYLNSHKDTIIYHWPLYASDSLNAHIWQAGASDSGYLSSAGYDSLLAAKRYVYKTVDDDGVASLHFIDGYGTDSTIVLGFNGKDGWIVTPQVTRLSDYDYSVSAGGIFQLDNTIYNVTPTIITLDSADGTDRIDEIYADTTHNYRYGKGDPGEYIPDPNSEIKVTIFSVPTASPPAFGDSVAVYRDNNEWVVTNGGTTDDPDNLSNVCEGSKSVSVTNNTPGDYLQFTRASPIDVTNYGSLSGQVRLKAVLPTNASLRIQTLNGTTVVSTSTAVIPLLKSNITTCQTFSIPLPSLGLTSNIITAVRILYSNTVATNYAGFYADDIYFQAGITQPVTTPIDTSNKWINNIAYNVGGDSALFWIGSVRHAIKVPVQAGDGNGIYSGSGSILADRTVTLGSHSLQFNGSNAVLSISNSTHNINFGADSITFVADSMMFTGKTKLSDRLDVTNGAGDYYIHVDPRTNQQSFFGAASSATDSKSGLQSFSDSASGNLYTEIVSHGRSNAHQAVVKVDGMVGVITYSAINGYHFFDGMVGIGIDPTSFPALLAVGGGFGEYFLVTDGSGIFIRNSLGSGSAADSVVVIGADGLLKMRDAASIGGGGGGGSSTLAGLSDVSVGSPTTGDILKYNGTAWVNTPSSGFVTTTLSNGKFLVGNGSNAATAVTPTGDVTFDNAGAFSIGSSKVTNTMLSGSIAASKLIKTDITTVGTITVGGLGTGAVIAGVTMTVGSDATGDIYYRNSSGILTRLAIGTSKQTLHGGTIPQWLDTTAPGGSFTAANLTAAGTDGIAVTGGTNAVNGSGTSVAQHAADATHNGYLPSTDWNTFNNKANAASTGTYYARLNLTPSDGLTFNQTTDGLDAPAGRYYYLNGVWNLEPMRPEMYWSYFQDFGSMFNTNVNDKTFIYIASGTGSAINISNGAGVDGYEENFQTGTTTTGKAEMKMGTSSAGSTTGFRASTASQYYKTVIDGVSQKSNLSDVFNIEAGFSSNENNTPASVGYEFYYDSTTSANWLYRNGNGSLTSTGVAFAANTAYNLEVLVRSDSVFYRINGSMIASLATVSNTTYVSPLFKTAKSSGTTNVITKVDYLSIWGRLQTTRTVY